MSIIDLLLRIWKDSVAILNTLKDLEADHDRIESKIDDIAAGLIVIKVQLDRIEEKVTVEQAEHLIIVVGQPEEQPN